MAKKAKRSKKDSGDGREQPRLTVEIEQKYEIPPGFALPDLTGLPGLATLESPGTHRLEATYFDTDDLRLLAARRTLRRRTGGPDAGWHLKEPGERAGARSELTLPLGRAVRTVPAPLRDAVAVHTRGRELAPIARLSTTRTVHRLRDAEGSLLAEVVFDDVDAVALERGGEHSPSSWCEVEVEVDHAPQQLVEALAGRLAEAGARPSPSPSKLARALGRTTAADPVESQADDAPPRDAQGHLVSDLDAVGAGEAVRVLFDYLREEIAHLTDNDPLVRADLPDAVHQMRVACRRLRSALATFRPLVDRSVTDPVRAELRWIAAELGAARDAEVIRDHLLEAVAAEPSALRRGPVVRRIRTTMDARYREAHDRGLAQLRSPRYYALLDTLDDLLLHPPLAEGASGKGRPALARYVQRTWRRVQRLNEKLSSLDAEGLSPDDLAAQRVLVLHEIRKAAKRARYAGEALVPVFGDAAATYAEQMSQIQTALGEHQDTVVIRTELEGLADAATTAGESAFTYGRLHAQAQTQAQRTVDAYRQIWDRASPMRD